MAKKTDYSVQLPGIEDPKQSSAGDLMVRASNIQAHGITAAARAEADNTLTTARGQAAGIELQGRAQGAALELEGKADAIGIDTLGKTISFLGTTAVDATKGKLQADLSKEINDSLSKLEGFGSQALASEAELARLRSDGFARGVAEQLTALQEQTKGMEQPELVSDFMQEVSRHAEAQRQGVLSRGEVLTRISASVKKYSAMMPGWAADFRKVGAEMTGISNVDVYGVHKALTSESARETAAKRQMELQAQLDKEIASKLGKPIAAITPTDRMFYYQHKQLALGAENLRHKVEMGNLTQGEADKAYGQIIDMQISAGIADLGAEFANLGALHSDPAKALEAKEAGLKLTGKLTMMMNTLERSILDMTRPAQGRAALSVAEGQKRLEGVRSIVNNYQQALTSVEGRNMFAAVVTNAQGQVNVMMDKMLLANPHVAMLNRIGVTSELFKAYVSVGSKEEFEKRFGKDLANAIGAIVAAPQQHANLFGAIATGQPVDLRQVAQVSPELAKVTMSDMVTSIKEWAKNTAPTDQQKTAYSNVFAQAAINLNPAVPRDLKAMSETLEAPETQSFLAALDPVRRANALTPMVAKLNQTIPQVMAQVKASLDEFNRPESSTFARQGLKLQLRQNPLTGQLEVAEDRSGVRAGGPLFTDMPGGAAGAGVGMVGRITGANIALNPNSSEHKQRADGLVQQLNKMLETYTIAARIVSPESDSDINQVRAHAIGLFSKPVAAVPRNEPKAVPPQAGMAVDLDPDRVKNAIIAAERSDVNAGKSPAGALGKFQFMPETAKEYGLKVDPAAGIDERLDEEKAGAAAVAYMQNMSKQFGGNVPMMAAAYNAGPGSVKKAVEKAAALGDPSSWIAFLPKPEETASYIRRFMERYGTTKAIKGAAEGR